MTRPPGSEEPDPDRQVAKYWAELDAAAEADRCAAIVGPLAARDPDFSVAEFLRFASAIHDDVTNPRAAGAALRFTSLNLRHRLPGETARVPAAAARLQALETDDEYDDLIVEFRSDDIGDRQWWTFRRSAASTTSERTYLFAEGCAGCGAPLEDRDECANCARPLVPRDDQWTVVRTTIAAGGRPESPAVEELESTVAPLFPPGSRPGLVLGSLNPGTDEGGHGGPPMTELEHLQRDDPAFDRATFLADALATARVVVSCWKANNSSRLDTLCAPALHFAIGRSASAAKTRALHGDGRLDVDSVTFASMHTDLRWDTVETTVKGHWETPSGLHYTWHQRWIFQRASGAISPHPHPAAACCETCGAPLHLDLFGQCRSCAAAIVHDPPGWQLVRVALD